jgi:CRP-like cAMP-binding protein
VGTDRSRDPINIRAMADMAEGATMERLERLLALVVILEPLPQEEIERFAASRSFTPLGAGDTVALEENRRSLFLLVGSRKLPARYTHQQLGTMTGSNREAVTQAPKKLRKKGGWRSGGARSTSWTWRP